ncbi:MAG: cupin domain-containing protein [Nocardioidaceae bacterium]
MAGMEMKSFDAPDDRRPFVDKGAADVVSVAGVSVMKARYEPGWRWSEHIRPIVGTDSCQSTHFGYVISGRMQVVMDDGDKGEFGPNDVVRIEPGHDAWVVGDEPCVLVDFAVSPNFAKANE